MEDTHLCDRKETTSLAEAERGLHIPQEDVLPAGTPQVPRGATVVLASAAVEDEDLW